MCTTPLFFSRAVGGGEALSVAKGIAAMGAGEVGAGALCGRVGSGTRYGEAGVGVLCEEAGIRVAWAEEARGAVGEAEGVGRVEVPALLVEALPRTDMTPTSLAFLSSVITMPAPKKKS